MCKGKQDLEFPFFDNLSKMHCTPSFCKPDYFLTFFSKSHHNLWAAACSRWQWICGEPHLQRSSGARNSCDESQQVNWSNKNSLWLCRKCLKLKIRRLFALIIHSSTCCFVLLGRSGRPNLYESWVSDVTWVEG